MIEIIFCNLLKKKIEDKRNYIFVIINLSKSVDFYIE